MCMLEGHELKEIRRKIRSCVIEEGLSPDECVSRMEDDYELDDDDKFEIKELAKGIGK